MKTVAVGLSGGVDSTVAALLLKRQGFDLVGVTMTLGRADEAQALAEARAAAEGLAIPFVVVDLADAWKADVLGDLTATYFAGRTPNPCVRCNERVKFGLLPRYAFERLGCEAFATGHYARLEPSAEGPVLRRGVDRAKDQSYFLYRVAPEILSRTLLPLGGCTKAQIREIADAAHLAIAAKGDSQDFCGGDVQAILAGTSGSLPGVGEIVTTDGRVLGRHDGFWRYTIGQRKGLGIGGGVPYYVVGLDAAANRVIVGFREAAVVREFAVGSAVWFGAPPTPDEALAVKVRSAGEPKGPVRVTVSADGSSCRCAAAEGLLGVAPGQSAVFYRGDIVRGGGILL